MAQEFSKDELTQYSAEHRYGYEMLVRMAPYWRSFLLDEHELAQRKLIEDNARSHSSLYTFAAKITGIEVGQIEAIWETGDFITIAPPFNKEDYQQAFRPTE